MSRIRTIKPAFFRSLDIAALPKPTRLTYIGLWTYVDDEGRGVDDARLIKAELWPLDDDYTLKKVEADLKALAARDDMLQRYEVDGRRYLFVTNFNEHQTISRPQKSKLPPPPLTESSRSAPTTNDRSPHGALPEDSTGEGKGREGKGKGMDLAAPLEAAPPAELERSRIDPLWDAVVGVCGIDNGDLTDSARGSTAKAVADLRRVGAEPDEVTHRAGVYRRIFPQATLTPSALAKHWAQCAKLPPSSTQSRSMAALEDAVARRES